MFMLSTLNPKEIQVYHMWMCMYLIKHEHFFSLDPFTSSQTFFLVCWSTLSTFVYVDFHFLNCNKIAIQHFDSVAHSTSFIHLSHEWRSNYRKIAYRKILKFCLPMFRMKWFEHEFDAFQFTLWFIFYFHNT